jgi:dihydroflavonol-4-reductase
LAETFLVTGATGFIGSALCRALVGRGHHVRAFHRKTSSLIALQNISVELMVGDILKKETLLPAMEGVDMVFHTAAQSDYWRHPELVMRTAVEGTRNVMRAAFEAGIQRVVHTSSLAALGVPKAGELLTEDHRFNLPPEHFPYGYAKHQAELEALQVAARGLEVVIVNPSAVVGPGDLSRSDSMVTEVARGWGFFWIDGGVNIVYIDDVVTGHIAAAFRGRPGERYILGGENLTYRESFTTATEIAGKRPPWLKIPGWIIEPAAKIVEWLQPLVQLPFDSSQLRMSRHYTYCDSSKARRELGFPEPRPFRQVVEATFDWYREQGMI